MKRVWQAVHSPPATQLPQTAQGAGQWRASADPAWATDLARADGEETIGSIYCRP